MAEPVLVVGGGIAGMVAALHVAEAGQRVLVIDDAPVIGGSLLLLDNTFPTDSCGVCFMSPDTPAFCPSLECARHDLIDLWPRTRLDALEGILGQFTATLTVNPGYVNPHLCTACDLCSTACPEETPLRIKSVSVATETRKAIYQPAPQAIPSAYVIDGALCTRCGDCVAACPYDAIDLHASPRTEKVKVSAVILAPGFGPTDAHLRGAYGYGYYANVVTSLEYERMLSASSPGRGKPIRPGDGQPAQRIAFIHCVGSRDYACGVPYCSATCCMIAAKQVSLTKRRAPDTLITVFTMDVRAAGRGYERYLANVKSQKDIVYRRSLVSAIKQDTATGDLFLQYTHQGQAHGDTFNLVVLETGMVVPESIRQMSDCIGAVLNENGFALTDEYNPIATSRPGVFVAGAFREPKDIPATAAESTAAAAAALHIAQPATSYPDEDWLPERRALVLGGSIAGLVAAQTLSAQGVETHVVESLEYLANEEFPVDRQWLDRLVGEVEADSNIICHLNSHLDRLDRQPGKLAATIVTPDKQSELTFGGLIVATAARPHEPAGYGLGMHADVVTQSQFDALLSAGVWADPLDRIVMIQCADTRNLNRPYCSRTCCVTVLKHALALKKLKPEIQIDIVYRDMMTPGFDEQLYYEARQQGVRFVRTLPEHPVKITGHAAIVYDDVLGEVITLRFDLLVLSGGIVPGDGNADLAQKLGVALGEDGFFKPKNVKTQPMDLSYPGTYLAGLAGGPATLSELIEQGMAAGLRLALYLRHPFKSSPTIATVKERLCSGCGLCVEVCPVEARHIDSYRKVAWVDTELCLGCGSCAVVCPSGASQQTIYQPRDVLDRIEHALVGRD